MKRFRWNIGILIICLGYSLRGFGRPLIKNNSKNPIRWILAKWILMLGYVCRGNIPKTAYSWVEKLVVRVYTNMTS